MLVDFGDFAIDINRIFEIKKVEENGFFNKKYYILIVSSDGNYYIKCKNKQSCDTEYNRIIKIYYENQRNTKEI